mgnify:CR=1 FL=1
MKRFELIEIIVRSVKAKYLETGMFQTYLPALEHFFATHYEMYR